MKAGGQMEGILTEHGRREAMKGGRSGMKRRDET